MQQHLDHALDLKALRPLAKKYIWWETPDEALESPRRVIAQVMNIGTFEDASPARGYGRRRRIASGVA
jgi:hypothetical protein